MKTLVGFTPADTRTVDLPFEVSISTSDIGGPSAGLAFTLALLDELSPGELLGRRKVAATGTINEDGEFGAIGALVQKAVAVRDSGARVFLVPKDQTEDEIQAAQKAAGSGVRIIAVATLDEALHVLDELGGDPLPRINT
jgi:PDZ domain-containing protein